MLETINLPILTLKLLHKEGFGLLRIYAFVKDGGNAWRAGYHPKYIQKRVESWAIENNLYFGFVKDLYFDEKLWKSNSPEKLANLIIKKYPENLKKAVGIDESYTKWLDKVISHLTEDTYFCYFPGGGPYITLHGDDIPKVFSKKGSIQLEPPPI